MTKAPEHPKPAPATHSPLPWQVFDALGEFDIAITTQHETVTECLVEFHAYPNARADAAFIVRACNNHYQSLAALKNTLEYLPRDEYLRVCAIIAAAENK